MDNEAKVQSRNVSSALQSNPSLLERVPVSAGDRRDFGREL